MEQNKNSIILPISTLIVAVCSLFVSISSCNISKNSYILTEKIQKENLINSNKPILHTSNHLVLYNNSENGQIPINYEIGIPKAYDYVVFFESENAKKFFREKGSYRFNYYLDVDFENVGFGCANDISFYILYPKIVDRKIEYCQGAWYNNENDENEHRINSVDNYSNLYITNGRNKKIRLDFTSAINNNAFKDKIYCLVLYKDNYDYLYAGLLYINIDTDANNKSQVYINYANFGEHEFDEKIEKIKNESEFYEMENLKKEIIEVLEANGTNDKMIQWFKEQ